MVIMDNNFDAINFINNLQALINFVNSNSMLNSNNNIRNYTLSEWCDEWLKTYKQPPNIKQSTYDDYNSICNNWIKRYMGCYLLNNIDSLALQKQINAINYPRARDKVIQILNQLFTQAIKNGYMSKNPMLSIDVKKHKKESFRAFDMAQRRAILNECKNNKYGDLFALCLYTGMRRGEILALTRADINYNLKLINIDKSYCDNKINSPKTESSVRKTPMCDESYNILLKYKDLPNSKRLFPYSTTVINKQFKKLLILCGIYEKHYTFHSLRHTFITMCSERGVLSKTIAKWVGHNDVNTTLKIYTHINTDYEKLEINKLNGGI